VTQKSRLFLCTCYRDAKLVRVDICGCGGNRSCDRSSHRGLTEALGFDSLDSCRLLINGQKPYCADAVASNGREQIKGLARATAR